MVKRQYVPDRGDIAWLDFDPQSGREQAGRRPALVLTPSSYNQKAGLAIVCPITSRFKGYPFEVEVRAGRIYGVVLADQARSLDWRARRAERIGSIPDETLEMIRGRLAALLGLT